MFVVLDKEWAITKLKRPCSELDSAPAQLRRTRSRTAWFVDGSFHSPEWHAARLASLKTSHTITWEEFKKKQEVSCCA
ncbi:hypothetical protein Pint_26219 [Pistacia integerrima]|uniref:Uncharacterized protein n=1 Tax=Pistacia integerrima TaxID=434235 RepID=A0ACC0YG68_9ROSI|nr:hypothetical protein Pint_26219 [Pistacia integerrima]